MVIDFRVFSAADTCHNIVHGVPQCQRQIMGLSKPQHFGQVPLRVNIQQKNLFALHRKASAQVIHSRAFPDAALLIGNGNDLCFAIGISSSYRFSRLR